MQKLVVLSMVIAFVSCSSKPKEEQTTVSPVPPIPAEPAATEENIGAASATGADTATDSAGSAVGASGSDMERAGSAAAAGASAAKDHAGSAPDHVSHAAAPASTFDFDKLSHKDKMDFMKNQVVPTMKPLFQAFDKKKYANFGCKTCHGKDPVKAKYAMPNARLTKLDFAKLKEGKQAPKAAEWMAKVVKPTMAKLLQMSEYSEENPTGFGCLHCHVQKE